MWQTPCLELSELVLCKTKSIVSVSVDLVSQDAAELSHDGRNFRCIVAPSPSMSTVSIIIIILISILNNRYTSTLILIKIQ